MPTAGLTDEAARLSDVITELGKLDNDALVQRYVPEAKPVQGTALREALSQKGEHGPSRLVVDRSVPESRRTGGNPHPVHPSQAAPGRTYGYDKDGSLVRLTDSTPPAPAA
jgi:hypothetical protein